MGNFTIHRGPVLVEVNVKHCPKNRQVCKFYKFCRLYKATPWYSNHYNALTAKLSEIDYTLPTTGLSPSVLALFGDKAFPIATNTAGDVTIAGAEYGSVSKIIFT